MRGGRSLIAPSSDEFCLPHEVFELGLKQGPLLVYLYLICCKSLKHGADKTSCAIISKAVGLCEKTVRTHLHTLADTGFIKTEHHGQTFSYSLSPIQGKVREPRNVAPRNRWISRKQVWITGEVFEAVFPVPAEVFQLDLECGELLVYIYLHYQKGVRSGQCWPSYATIGAAVGMGRKTVQRNVHSLVDKSLIQAEDTTVRRKNGYSYNGNLLYTVKPVEQILKAREKEFLTELKLAEAQRRWDRRCQQRDSPRSAL